MSYYGDISRISDEEAELIRREQQINSIVKQLLTPEAWERLRRVEFVKPELARRVKLSLIQLYSAGRINRRITDSELKTLLARLSESTRRDFKIRVI